MKRSSAFFVGSALAVAAVSVQAAVTVYTDRTAFLAAISGPVLNDFEENGPGDYTAYGSGYDGGTYLFTSSSITIFTIDPAYDQLYDWGTGDVLTLQGGETTVTLDSGLRAFGFDFGNPVLWPGSGLITIDGQDYAQLVQPAFNFFGIVSDSAIDPISINWNGGGGTIDNLVLSRIGAVAVPLPGTLALVGLGLLGAAVSRRRAP
jgi:hypothetical protein